MQAKFNWSKKNQNIKMQKHLKNKMKIALKIYSNSNNKKICLMVLNSNKYLQIAIYKSSHFLEDREIFRDEMIRTAPYPINLALVEIIHWLRIIAISPRCSSAHWIKAGGSNRGTSHQSKGVLWRINYMQSVQSIWNCR